MNIFMLYYIWISMTSFIDSHQAFINRYIIHTVLKAKHFVLYSVQKIVLKVKELLSSSPL